MRKNSIEKTAQRDLLYEELPYIAENGNYILFSPYALKLAIIKQNAIYDPAVKNYLETLGFIGTPFEPGDTNRISRVTLILTNNCNLGCRYCYMFGGEGKTHYMSCEKAIEAIKLSVSCNKVDQLRISFFGGEPTMAFDQIQKVVRFGKELGVNLAFHISTNGVISEDILNYLVQEKFLIGVSMDGPPYLNDIHRPFPDGSSPSKIVESTIKRLAHKRARFLVRVTISSLNVNKMVESLEYWADLGARYIHFEPINMSGRTLTSHLETPDINEYIDSIKEVLDKAEELGVYIISSPFMNLLTPSTYYCTPTSGRSLLVTPEGAISRCYEVQNSHHKHQLFIVGRYEDRLKRFCLDNEKCQFMCRLSVVNYDECKNCFAKYLCGGGCHLRNLNATGTLLRIDPYSCKIRKELIREAILRIKKSVQTNAPSPVLGINAYENCLSWVVSEENDNRDVSRHSTDRIRLPNGERLIILTFPLPDEVEGILGKRNKVLRIKDRCESVF